MARRWNMEYLPAFGQRGKIFGRIHTPGLRQLRRHRREHVWRRACGLVGSTRDLVYTGDARSRNVCLRVGFHPTDHLHIMVVWNQELSDGEKSRRFGQVTALDPF